MKSVVVNGHSHRLLAENERLRDRLSEAEETLRAIRNGDVDAVVVNGRNGQKVYSLEQAENLYRRLAETVREPMLALNKSGIIVFFNNRAQELLGFSPEQIVGRGLWEFIVEADRPCLYKLLAQAGREQGAQGRAAMISAESIPVPVLWRANVLASREEKLVCLVGTDLTRLEASEETVSELEAQRQQLMEAQRELETSHQRYADLYDSAPVGYLTLTGRGWIRDINSTGAQILGGSRQEFLRTPLLSQIALSDGQKLLAHFSLCRRRGERMSTELRLRTRPDESPRFVELISARLEPVAPYEKGGRNSEDGFKSIITDITTRKQVDLALRESEQRFRSLADSAPVLIWMVDLEKRCTYVNRRYLEFTGRELPEQLSQGWNADIHLNDVKRCDDVFSAAFKNRRTFCLEYRFRRHDGQDRWMLGYGTPRFSAENRFVGYIGSCIDITERQQTEKSLELMSRFPKENPSPVMRLQDGRTLNFANPASREVIRFWKVKPGEEVPLSVSRIARRALLENERQVNDLAVGGRRYQVQFAPVPSAGYVNLYFDDITARIRSEAALRESEARFRTLASHAPVGIFMSKLNGDAIYVNESWCDMAGMTPAQAMGKGWLKAVHPEDRRRVTSEWRRSLKLNDSSRAEFRFRRPDGSVAWIHGFASRLNDPEGQISGYIGTASDITGRKLAEEALQRAHNELEQRVRVRTRELTRTNARLKQEIATRKKTESALRESEERSRLMIEGTRDYAIFMLDTEGRVASWNKGAELVTGYRANEILGRHFACFYTPQDRRRGKPSRVLEIARRTGRVVEEGWRCPKRKKQFWANEIITALRDKSGRLRSFLKVTRDMTESRKAQEELRTNERSLADFFNQSPLALLWVGRQGRVRRINRAGLELFDSSLEECMKRSVQDFFVEPKEATELLRRVSKREGLQNHRVRLRRKNGSIRHVLIDANGWWEHGRMVCSRWFVRDITRQVELEREILSVAEQERQRLGQDLHDDLCQQLTGIEFLSQTLAGQLVSHSARNVNRAREIARMIRQAITHTRELAHGLSPTELEADGLNGALQQLAERTHSMFRVKCGFQSKAPVEFKDPEWGIHLYRIAQEAVTNAVKHGKAKRVGIKLIRNRRGLMLTVADNGTGLPPSLHKSRGMGLRVMEYRAGVIGGTLEFHRNPTGGTTVTCSVSNEFINLEANLYDEDKQEPDNVRNPTTSVHRGRSPDHPARIDATH